jgi:hypothetical protein
MTSKAELTQDVASVVARVPLNFRRRGGRKQVLAPKGSPNWLPHYARIDSSLLKALARAHRWQDLLESGTYSSIGELAAAERINSSYLCRLLRLTLLAPDIVEAVLNGSHDPERITLATLMRPFAFVWREQAHGPTGPKPSEQTLIEDAAGVGSLMFSICSSLNATKDKP